MCNVVLSTCWKQERSDCSQPWRAYCSMLQSHTLKGVCVHVWLGACISLQVCGQAHPTGAGVLQESCRGGSAEWIWGGKETWRLSQCQENQVPGQDLSLPLLLHSGCTLYCSTGVGVCYCRVPSRWARKACWALLPGFSAATISGAWRGRRGENGSSACFSSPLKEKVCKCSKTSSDIIKASVGHAGRELNVEVDQWKNCDVLCAVWGQWHSRKGSCWCKILWNK